MTPTEIATLNQLPPTARQALAKVPGPGWLVTPEGVATPYGERPVIWQEGLNLGWCPADPMAVLEVARVASGLEISVLVRHSDGTHEAYLSGGGEIRGLGPEADETALLAALRVVGRVFA